MLALAIASPARAQIDTTGRWYKVLAAWSDESKQHWANDSLRQVLIALAKEDQAARQGLTADRMNDTAMFGRLRRVDSANTLVLREIIRRFGWPGRSLVGSRGASAAWLIAQHSDALRDEAMRLIVAMKPGEVSPADRATMLDRVLVGQGKPQRYGTLMGPFRGDSAWLFPVEQPAGIERRRADAGLPPLASYRAMLSSLYRVRVVPHPTGAAQLALMNDLAQRYVTLVLAVGQHDSDYVDAYYGPPAWKPPADAPRRDLAELRFEAGALLAELGERPPSGADPMERLRHAFLVAQLGAVHARIEMLQGRRFTFDDESRALYGVVAPHHDEAHFQRILTRLDALLPGAGPVAPRYASFRAAFAIPRDRIDPVFRAALEACRTRSAAQVTLPPGEAFTLEYVTDKPWSGYNWYQGGARSVIQVNTALPIYIDRALDLMCHEGYPGHHVYNTLLEQHLVRARGWAEFQIYPLFSPQSLVAEGSANYGIDLVFPGDTRAAFERGTLYPLAGLDPARAADYDRVQALVKELRSAGNEAARRYLDGRITGEAAADWLSRYALMSPEAADQRVRFIDRYRSYVINYNLGEDLVRRYVEGRAGSDADARWRVFVELLSTPTLVREP